MKHPLERSRIGTVRDNLRDLGGIVLRKIRGRSNKDGGEGTFCVFVDKAGNVYAACAASAATMRALVNRESELVGTYSMAGWDDKERVNNRASAPSADEIAEDIAQHENSFAVVREFLREAA
jgi:hypothetical protein